VVPVTRHLLSWQTPGQRKNFEYIEAFGFGRLTGIDYPGRKPRPGFSAGFTGPAGMATTSFGQGVSVTPIQQVMAIAAMANGGYLYKPYLVDEI
jgi:stage V sporulation protein D (sporulation-specific penicillin-binding protein)